MLLYKPLDIGIIKKMKEEELFDLLNEVETAIQDFKSKQQQLNEYLAQLNYELIRRGVL